MLHLLSSAFWHHGGLPLADPASPSHTPNAKIYLRFGTPTLRPFPAALGPWLQGIAMSTEFYHVLLSTLMVSCGCSCRSQQLGLLKVGLIFERVLPRAAVHARCERGWLCRGEHFCL